MTGYQSKKAAALDEEGFYTAYPKEEDDDIQVYQRPWVGLTDEDFYGQSELQRLAMKYAEAKLKELNT